MGYTGCGKSSLLNALVDEETILPCNDMRASTAVVVQMSWNKSEEPEQAYRAEIDFISAEEWTREFEVLAHDIKNRPAGEKLDVKSGSDSSIACAKIAAVYPGADVLKLLEMPAEELLAERDLSDILGQTITINESEASTFAKTINGYVDSNNKGGNTTKAAFWPLVRLVKVFVRAPLLQHGLVLVDLPGLGDSNAGRTHVAENYMKNLRYVWVVADIVRAVDDRVARDLMGRSFRRQLLMDDKYDENFITFIMTKTDIINIQNMINNSDSASSALKDIIPEEKELLDVRDEAKVQIEKISQRQKERKIALANLDKEEKTLKSSGGKSESILKRKFDQIEDSMSESKSDNEIVPKREGSGKLDIPQTRKILLDAHNEDDKAKKLLRDKISKGKKRIAALQDLMKVVCIGERNEYTQNHLKEDFRSGLLELEEELTQTADESSISSPKGTLTLKSK